MRNNYVLQVPAFIIFTCLVLGICAESVVTESDAVCTYFEYCYNSDGARSSAPESSLVNCSWYASNACCKRTEVTSVFGGMYPLFGATKDCSNQMNYLMCYFCSPQQSKWYKKKAFVCSEYCDSVFENCKTAEYNGSKIGEEYNSGADFCKGQKFEVVEDDGEDCFNFDPTVFSHAYQLISGLPTMTIPLFVLFLYLVKLCRYLNS